MPIELASGSGIVASNALHVPSALRKNPVLLRGNTNEPLTLLGHTLPCAVELPHTYIGKGVLTNPRKTDGSNGTYVYDIKMENDLPEYLQYDFGLTKE